MIESRPATPVALPRRAALTAGVFALAALLYVPTLAPGTIFGDPSEYQFIPAIWGIAHPPGYAVYTLLAGVWQRVVRIGSVAYRTNLLAAAAGAWAVSRMALVTLSVAAGADAARESTSRAGAWIAAGLAALGLLSMPDLWQHSIHANAHVVSAALTATQLWLLVRWQATDRRGWLWALAFCVGIGVTHHPITVWGLPAYAAFILLHRPRLLREPLTILGGLVAGLLGLLPWLYFPLRSPTAPFGPTDMATWAGFLRHATAQGLRVNLFHFGLADLPDRAQVFLSLLQLQFGWLLIGVILLGVVHLLVARTQLGVLWLLFLAGHLAFTLNSVQDVMAYLLHPLVALGLPLGLGALTLARSARRLGRAGPSLVAAALALVMVGRAAYLFPRISLASWREADQFVAELADRFRGTGAEAALVADWEHLTPYFYHTYVEGLDLPEGDLRPVYVTGASPWVESVFGNLPQGPVYLSNYRRDVREIGFRLRPEDNGLWAVIEPPATAPVAPEVALDGVGVGDTLELLGYDLPVMEVAQGGVVPLVLYARAPVTPTHILMPWAELGAIAQRWTTDSRRLTPDWVPGEIIAERYELFVPYNLAPGTYPLTLHYVDMSDGNRPLTFSDGAPGLDLGTLRVQAHPAAGRVAGAVDRALVNIGNNVALAGVGARVGLDLRRGPWEQPLAVSAGQPLHVTLRWRVLARPRMSYTVFLHLIDAAGQPWVGHDYTPLGGAFPSYLWFPKWLEGQQVSDPYRLALPDDLPPGRYWLEVGMYEMGSVRRIPQFNAEGTLTGDRYLLGPIEVVP